MPAAPITIKLRCTSWGQLQSIYQRDLTRGGLFLKSSKPPPVGSEMRIDLTLPSDSLIVLRGRIAEHVPPGGLDGRGPGIDVALETIPQSAMWLIEQALESHAKDVAAKAAKAPKAAPAAPVSAAAPEDAAVEAGRDIADAEDELIDALEQEFQSLRRLNPFQVLGIGYDTTDEQVRASFGELTRRYHPDRFARYQSQEARRYASEIFILVRDAYRRLGNAKARERTLEQIKHKQAGAASRGTRPAAAAPARPTGQPRPASPAPAPAPPAAPPPAARPALSGSELFGNDPAPAPAAVVGAREVEIAADRRATGTRTYSDAEALLDAGEVEQALTVYRAGARTDPGDRAARAGVELCEGLRALAARDRLEAAQRFEAVLELDPTNERAARELADMRRVATAERKGLLARLLGKGG